MKLSAGITLLLMASFLWFAYQGNLFQVVHTWDDSSWAIVSLAAWAGWVMRNEFGG